MKWLRTSNKSNWTPPQIPSYCGPHSSGQSYSYWPKGTPLVGEKKYHGIYGTKESRENYRRWLAELGTTNPTNPDDTQLLLIIEGWEKWRDYVESKGMFRKHGKPTSTIDNYCSAMSWLLPLYGSMLAQDFGPRQLSIVCETMDKAGLARSTINSYLDIIKRVWRFFARMGIVDRDAFVAMEACQHLQKSEGGKETAPINSIPEEVAMKVLDEINLHSPPIKTMLEICCWSGCRIGEILIARTCDIKMEDTSIPQEFIGKCWVFRPYAHKTEHRNKNRIILLGPQAISIIEPWLRPTEPEAYLFQPFENMLRIKKLLSKNRPKKGNTRRPRRLKDNRPYDYSAVWKAIVNACDKLGVPHWHSHQLRHLAATRLAQKYNLEITSILLGHSDIKTTLKYVDVGVLTHDDRARYAQAIAAIVSHG